jgi:hypothetical protein
MKKITLLLLTVLFSFQYQFAQSTYIVEAPLNNNTPNTNRAPNGSAGHVYMRAVYLVLQSELANIPSGTSLTTFGFTLFAGAAGSSATGNFTVYLENTTDVTYQKGTTYATAIAPMTSVFANVMTIPVSAATTSVVVTLSSPFTYTGGGLYVAFDWYNPGPYATTGANFLGENATLPLPSGGGANAIGGTSAPTSLNLTPSRPSFLFGFNNTYTNEAYVIGVEAPGKVAAMFNTPHIIKALVQNTGTVTLTNKQVSLAVSGANVFASTATITSLSPGSTTLVSFAAFNPTVIGMNSITVSVSADNNNSNNSIVYSQMVTCNEWAQNPPVGNYTVNSVGYGAGSGIIGTPYNSPVNSSLSGIRGAVSMNSGNVGQQMYALLVSNTGVILGTTTPIVLTSTMLGTFQTFTFSTPVALSANTSYYLCLAQTTGTAAWSPFGTLSSYYVPQNLIYYSSLNAGFMSVLTPNYGYFGIEGVFVPDIVQPVSSPTAVCTGSSAILTAQGLANTFTWNPGGSNSMSITVTPTANSVYSVTGSYSNQCSSTGTVYIMVVPLPNVTAVSSPTAICAGNTVALTAGGASTYTWDTNANTQTTIESPGSTTVYTVTGTSAAGCVNSNTVEVVVNTFTPSISSPTTVCLGSAITLTAGGGNSYVWINNNAPFSAITVTPSVNTTYTVNGTDANGCKGSASVPVFINPNPTVTASASRTLMCRNEIVNISAQGAGSYSWNTGTTSASFNFTAVIALPQSFTVTGTDINGCKAKATVSVQVSACNGLSEVLNASVRVFPSPGNGLYTVNNPGGTFDRIRIYNSAGILVKEQDLDGHSGIIDIVEAASGIYEVYITNGSQFTRSRIIKE